jgi:hypothetical protein
MQQQEKNRAIIISGLRAGWSAWEIIDFHNIKRSTVFSLKKKFDEFVASGGLPDDFRRTEEGSPEAQRCQGPHAG